MEKELLEVKWGKLIEYVSENYGGGEKLDLQAVLFLIGIQELGLGYKNFTKDEKMDLLHIAICKLLSRYGYYAFKENDKDGWPHYESNKKLPPLSPVKQEELMKEAAIYYFQEADISL